MTIRAPHFSPRRERPTQQPAPVPNLLVTTLAVVVAVPFVANEQTVPQTQETQQPLQLGSPLALIEPAVEKPFVPIDWPNPTLTVEIQTPFQVGMPLTILEHAGDKPFVQSDWPNPEPIFIKQPEQVGKSIALLPPVVGDPFVQHDWPNPLIAITQPALQIGKSLALVETVVVDERGSTVFSYGQGERREKGLYRFIIEEEEILIAVISAFMEVKD